MVGPAGKMTEEKLAQEQTQKKTHKKSPTSQKDLQGAPCAQGDCG